MKEEMNWYYCSGILAVTSAACYETISNGSTKC